MDSPRQSKIVNRKSGLVLSAFLISILVGAIIAIGVAGLIHRFGQPAFWALLMICTAVAFWIIIILASGQRDHEACRPDDLPAKHQSDPSYTSDKSEIVNTHVQYPTTAEDFHNACSADINRRLAQDKL